MDLLLVRKSALTGGFLDGWKLVELVEFLVTGDLSACMAVFPTHALLSVMMVLNRNALQPEQLNNPSQPLQSSLLSTSIFLQPERLLFLVVLITTATEGCMALA